jgi:hypothetical protein
LARRRYHIDGNILKVLSGASGTRRDDVRLDHSVYRPGSKARGDFARRRFGGLSQGVGVAGFDLAAERASLTEADRRIAAGRRDAAPGHGLHRGVAEAGTSHLGDDPVPIVITVRRSCQKARRIAGEHLGDRCGGEIGELIVF